MFFFFTILIHQGHAPIFRDALRDMDNQIAVFQIQKIINRTRISIATTRFDLARLRPRKQFVVADHNKPVFDQPKPLGHSTFAKRDSL